MPSRASHTAAAETTLTQPVHDQVLAVAKRLRTALRRALEEGVPPPRRMTTLCEVLAIDKSLASRITRAAAAADPLTALALGPGVTGYLLLTERLRVRNPTSRSIDSLVDAVVALQKAYDHFPDGRRGFEAALAGWLPQKREPGERRARQQIYQATLFLMGVEVDVAYHTYIYTPSASDAEVCDLGYLEVRQDVRRARGGTRAILTGVPFIIPGPETGNMRLETFSGETPTNDARVALLPSFSTAPLPSFETATRGGSLLLIAAGDTPAVGDRLTTAAGVVGRNMIPRSKGASGPPFLQNTLLLRKPVRLMIVDVLIDDSLRFGDPLVTVSAASIAGAGPKSPLEDDLAAIPQTLAFEPLGMVSSGSSPELVCGEVRNLPKLIDAALAVARPAPTRLRAYRLRIEFPIPHARHTIWLSLPPRDAPGPTSAGKHA